MARVLGEIFLATEAGSISKVSGSISAKTGTPPSYSAALALAAKVMAGTITSSPGLMRSARMAQCSAAVPELTATPSPAPQWAAKACSNSDTRGPVVSQPEQSASTTALTSASAISCLPYGRNGTSREPSRSGIARRLGETLQDHIAVFQLDGAMGIVGRDHGLVQFLAGPDADDMLLVAGADQTGELGNGAGRDLGHIDLAALHHLHAGKDEIHPLRQRDPEAGHALVGDRQAVGAIGDQFLEE